jgi:hypothetical protein
MGKTAPGNLGAAAVATSARACSCCFVVCFKGCCHNACNPFAKPITRLFPVVEGAIERQSVAVWDLGLEMRMGAPTMGSLPRDLAPAGRLKHLRARLRTRHRHAVCLRYHTDPYKMYRYQPNSREKKNKKNWPQLRPHDCGCDSDSILLHWRNSRSHTLRKIERKLHHPLNFPSRLRAMQLALERKLPGAFFALHTCPHRESTSRFAACPGSLAEGVTEMTPGWDPRDQQPAVSLRPTACQQPRSLEPSIHTMEHGTCKIASQTAASFAALHSASLPTAISRRFDFIFLGHC